MPGIEEIIKSAQIAWNGYNHLCNNKNEIMLRSRDLQPSEVGEALSIQLDGFRYFTVPRSFDLLLGFISDSDFTSTVEIGGQEYSKLDLKSNVPHPAFISSDNLAYFIPMLEYHEITLSNVPTNAKVYAIGSWLGNEAKQAFTSHVYKVGDMYIDRGIVAVKEFTKLPHISI